MITHAELLDVVRRLRSYVATIDNIHQVFYIVNDIDDTTIRDNATKLLADIPAFNTRVSKLLKQIEASKQYRDMAKKFNMED